jgi:aminoglycoside phosphotransferase
MPLHLPPDISGFIGNAALQSDAVADAPCAAYKFRRGTDVFSLKASTPPSAPTGYSVAREADILRWLSGRLGVPELVRAAQHDGYEYMITRAVPGVPLFSLMENEDALVELFLEALRQMQSVAVSDCPFDASASMGRRGYDHLLGNDLIPDDYVLPQWPGPATPADLLPRPMGAVPPENLVFSHGDLGDVNVFVDARDALYFVDLGRGGLADRWLDIASVHRNLREEISARAAAGFLARLGLPDAPAKRQYFGQLDELSWIRRQNQSNGQTRIT